MLLLPLYQKKTNTMASNLFKRYIWLADTIHRYGPITLAEIRARWRRSTLYDGRPLARRTFCTHRQAVEELFDITIVCDERTNRYAIADSGELTSRSITNWLLDTFAVGQSLHEAPRAAQPRAGRGGPLGPGTSVRAARRHAREPAGGRYLPALHG